MRTAGGAARARHDPPVRRVTPPSLPSLPSRSASPVAHFKWHTKPITSVEWAPDDENVLAVASSDNTVTLWDMSLEEDAEAEAALGGGGGGGDERPTPSQLLFIHAGQEDMKEAHFHAQLPGVVISTAADGFNVCVPARRSARIFARASNSKQHPPPRPAPPADAQVEARRPDDHVGSAQF